MGCLKFGGGGVPLCPLSLIIERTTIPIGKFCLLDLSSTVSSMTMFIYGSKPRNTPITVRPPFSFTAHR